VDRGISEADLHAYVDGQLAAERHEAVERWLLAHPQDAARVADYRHVTATLHSFLDRALEEPVPPRLLARPSPPLRSLRRTWPPRLAMAFGTLAAGLLIGWLARGILDQRASFVDALLREAVAAHAAAPSPQTAAADEAELRRWLSQRVGHEVGVPDLEDLGFRFRAGRLLAAADGSAVQLIYETAAGDRMSLYVMPPPLGVLNLASGSARREAWQAFYWVDGKIGCVLTGGARIPNIEPAAHSAYRQLAESG
jgi:anti-sigma factor RsiW